MLAIATAALCLLLLAGCGTPGAPLPPSLNLPRPAADLAITRKGDRLTLVWSGSTDTTDDATVKGPVKTRICFAVQRRMMEACENPVDVAPHPVPGSSKKMAAEFPIPANAIARDAYAAVALEMQNSQGHTAGLSNQVLAPLEVVDTPERLTATIGANSIRLQVIASGIGRHCIVRVYRREKGQARETQVAGENSSCAEFGRTAEVRLEDASFEWEKAYQYRAVTVVSETLPDGRTVVIESGDSPTAEIVAHDTFPPAQPAGLQAVFSGGIPGQANAIDLTWDANMERDLAGYNTYRREQGQPAASDIKLNSELVKAPAFRDLKVEAGHRYVYSVSAVDLRGNESRRSAETSEAAPQ